jgi:cytochrome c biogenesis protein
MSSVSTLSTSGLQLRRGSRPWRSLVELLSSMRFAIALLVIVAIASVIGTVLEQGQAPGSYVDQFGPFWAAVFLRFSLDNVYSSWWFLAIMGVLMLSTSLCLIRNTPKILADVSSYKDHLREQGLRSFHDRAEARAAPAPEQTLARLEDQLRRHGYKSRRRDRDGATLLAAKTGGLSRLGYILTHASFVLICIGGLLDGDVMIRLQMLLGGKHLLTTNMNIVDVPATSILSNANPSYRGNVSVAEGGSSNTAVLSLGEGSVLQPLPFSIKLKKFVVDYYSTGMPRLFSSQVELTDRSTGKVTAATVKVNEPVKFDGVTIFQSGFDDGGSHLQLHAWPMRGGGDGFDIDGDVGGSRQLSNGHTSMRLEFTGFRLMNVESLAAPAASAPAGLFAGFDQHLGAAVKLGSADKPTNVGPAVVYKLRDAAGQASEFFNYMQPIVLDGVPVFVAGERSELGGAYQYLRMPADADGKLDGWMRLRAALADPVLRSAAVDAYVRGALPANAAPTLAPQLRETAARTLDMFAGAIPRDPASGAPLLKAPGGLPALAEFIEQRVPKAQQAKASDVFVQVLNGVLWQLWTAERARHGDAAPTSSDADNRFFNAAVPALSDAVFYPAPLYLQLTGFQQVQASVFQVARAPGKVVVYFGAILLMLGVFAMLYIRERRVWFLVRGDGEGGSRILMAMSTNRRTLDFEQEFARLRDATLGAAAPERI